MAPERWNNPDVAIVPPGIVVATYYVCMVPVLVMGAGGGGPGHQSTGVSLPQHLRHHLKPCCLLVLSVAFIQESPDDNAWVVDMGPHHLLNQQRVLAHQGLVRNILWGPAPRHLLFPDQHTQLVTGGKESFILCVVTAPDEISSHSLKQTEVAVDGLLCLHIVHGDLMTVKSQQHHRVPIYRDQPIPHPHNPHPEGFHQTRPPGFRRHQCQPGRLR
mmetsp:Transcript_98932/g.264569  ORF Transcript_98932/g.264569 Transcript_98932/m.264569 type:complete len:216 (-) Transcript_98932:164-811(-)